MKATVYNLGGNQLTTIGNLPVVDDPIFFRKDQIKPGVALVYYGRRARKRNNNFPTKWMVTRLIHYYTVKPNRKNNWRGKIKYKRIDTPLTYDSVAILKCENGAQMELTINYLSYSAIWRLS